MSTLSIENESVNALRNLSMQEQTESGSTITVSESDGVCAICLEKIVLEDRALIKGCEHAYCVTCILRWATYNQKPSCPQCKNSFEFLSVHRSLDGRICDYMFEESVCLLLRATWFNPLVPEVQEEAYDEQEEIYQYEDECDGEDDLDEAYYHSTSSSSLRIGNRRWGDNGYVKAGRKEARVKETLQDSGAGPSNNAKKKEVKDKMGRRAKRTLKREAAHKAAASKHQQHLARLGRE